MVSNWKQYQDPGKLFGMFNQLTALAACDNAEAKYIKSLDELLKNHKRSRDASFVPANLLQHWHETSMAEAVAHFDDLCSIIEDASNERKRLKVNLSRHHSILKGDNDSIIAELAAERRLQEEKIENLRLIEEANKGN